MTSVLESRCVRVESREGSGVVLVVIWLNAKTSSKRAKPTVPQVLKNLVDVGGGKPRCYCRGEQGEESPQSPTVGHDSFNTVPVLVKSKSTGLASIRLYKMLSYSTNVAGPFSRQTGTRRSTAAGDEGATAAVIQPIPRVTRAWSSTVPAMKARGRQRCGHFVNARRTELNRTRR